MADRGQEPQGHIRDALLNIARQANDILRNYRSNNINNIERVITNHGNGDTASENQEIGCTVAPAVARGPHPPSNSSTRTERSQLSPNDVSSGHSSGSTVSQLTICDALRKTFPTFANDGNRKRGKGTCTTSKKGKEPAKKSKKQNAIIYKDIVLLPRPEEKSVPTHRTRITLENEGYVVHEFPINKSWDERQLYSEIKNAFPVLDTEGASIQFVKACYGDIVVPKVADGVKMNATRLLSIVGQGCVYLMPDRALGQCLPVDVEESDSELNSSPFEEHVVIDDETSQGSTLTQTKEPTRGQQQLTLKEIFPDIEEVELVNALYSSD